MYIIDKIIDKKYIKIIYSIQYFLIKTRKSLIVLRRGEKMNLWLIFILLGVVAVIGGGVAAAIGFGIHQKRANERAIRDALELAIKDKTQREQE